MEPSNMSLKKLTNRQTYRVIEAPSGSLINFWALLMQINIFAFCGIGQLSILIWYVGQTDIVIYRSSYLQIKNVKFV